jgi:hypothetical protein
MSAVQEVITAAEVTAAREKRTSLIEKMAGKYHLDPKNMMATLKATAFAMKYAECPWLSDR